MSASGRAAQRISFGEGSYSTPVWSPRGDNIAFTKLGRGSFAIGIMKPDGSGERILTEGFHNEGPTFAPNGRVMMFFRDPGGNAGPSLFTVDITGRNEQRVPTPGFASDPAWSPLLTSSLTERPRIPAAPQGGHVHASLTMTGTFRGAVHFSRPRQRLVKVDGTFA